MTKGLDAPLLFPEKGAGWIYIDRPFILAPQREGERVSYRKRFRVEHAPLTATLTIRALRVADVSIDGNRIPAVKSELARWKGTQVIELSGYLAPGMHEAIIRVFNEHGPAVLLASCATVGLFTGQDWEASYDELLWTRAVAADKKKTLELVGHFTSTYKAFLSLLPFYVSIFLAVFFLTRNTSSSARRSGGIRKFLSSPSGIRWLLLALWAVLAINNILKVPAEIGMDIQGHYEYIEYVANTGRIPLATEGWEMFQSPLYYIISAMLWNFPLSRWFDVTTAMLMLRIIPLLCGLLQVELSYRAARSVFPLRRDLQVWGTVIGGLLPMNLYISQVVGNEPLAGLLSASAVVMGFVLLTSEREVIPERHFIFLGAALGLALLTKVTAILLVPPAVILTIYVLHKRRQSLRYTILRVSLVLGFVFVIAGWYYLRNWIELGRPFVGNWESSAWWQDPGYRTASDFLSFGRSLSYPIYSALQGFWDSLYSTLWLDGFIGAQGLYEFRPPWHYNFMLSGALLSLVPATGIILGILITIASPYHQEHHAQLFAVCCTGVYLAALLYMYISLPIFSNAKATYALGLIPCYAILAVTGLDFLSRNNLLRAIINALLACWAVAAYCSYFVL